MNELRRAALESQQKFLSVLLAAERTTLISMLQPVLAANDTARQRPGEDNA